MSRPATLKVGSTSYWTIMTYTSAGVLVDADSVPTVVVYKNGTLTADVVTITKRSATTGIYDAYYNPASEAEGDCFTIQETATISSQAYVQSWNFEVLAAERGTDNASTFDAASDTVTTDTASRDASKATGFNTVAPDNASISAILADTNELQTNQGDWATATGFATVNPDNASITAIKSKTDQFVFTVANQVDANALTGSGGASPADIWTYGTRTITSGGITAQQVEDAVWNASASNHNIGGTYGKHLRQIKEGQVSTDGEVNDASATTGS